MSVVDQLSSALGRRDEVPNQQLAAKIVAENDFEAIKELVENLDNKKLQNDCIKVLYEAGASNPHLIAGEGETFLRLLSSKNNRLQWGAMTALYVITPVRPAFIADSLARIIQAADSGSVISRDNAVNILVSLATHKVYAESAIALLMEQFLLSPVNQLPMYAEKALPVITKEHKDGFLQTLSSRLNDIEQESKRKRVVKVMEKAARL